MNTFNATVRKAGVDRAIFMDINGHCTTEIFLNCDTMNNYDVWEAMERLSSRLEEGSTVGCSRK